MVNVATDRQHVRGRSVGADKGIMGFGIGIVAVNFAEMIADAMVLHCRIHAAIKGPVDKFVGTADEAVVIVDGVIPIARTDQVAIQPVEPARIAQQQ